MNWELLAIIAGACWLLGFFAVCLLRNIIWTLSFSLSFDILSVLKALGFSLIGSIVGAFLGLSIFVVGIVMFADGGFKEDPTILAYVFVATAVLGCSALATFIGLSGKPNKAFAAQANS